MYITQSEATLHLTDFQIGSEMLAEGLYITFYLLSMVKVLAYTPVVYIYINYSDHEEGYFYLGQTYLEIDVMWLVWVVLLTCLEKIPRYQRFGPFTIYCLVDLIVSFTICAHVILNKNYNVPFIEDNIYLFFIAVGISFCFKVIHLFITVSILIISDKKITIKPPPLQLPLIQDDSPPKYENPPTYIAATEGL